MLIAVLVGSVQARQPVRLTRDHAHKAAAISAKTTIGTLLYRSVGSAPVVVTHCRVSGARGSCRVRVRGTDVCTYVAHVLAIDGGAFLVWGDGLSCRP